MSNKFILFLLYTTFSFSGICGWIQQADFGAQGRHRGTGITIANKGYFGLGHYNGTGVNIILADWWEYDPSNNTWSQKADYPGNGGGGNYAVVSFGIGNYGFVGGGITGGNSFYKYDPTMNNWTQVANMPSGVSDLSGFAIDKFGYYVQGSQMYAYNADTDQWTTKAPPPFNSSFWNSTFTINGKGYMKIGYALWEYKPGTDSWLLRAPFPGMATSASVGLNQNGKGYIVAGFASSLSNVNSEVWEFDPLTNTWTQLPDFPGSSRRFSSGFTIGNRAFFGIGTNGTNFHDFWEFNALLSKEEMQNEITVSCYPNPTNDYLNIQIEQAGDYRIELLDQHGRRVLENDINTVKSRIDCRDLNSGTYIYKVIDQSGQISTGTIVKL